MSEQSIETATCRSHGNSVTRIPVVSRNRFTGQEKSGLIESGCVECLREMKKVREEGDRG